MGPPQDEDAMLNAETMMMVVGLQMVAMVMVVTMPNLRGLVKGPRGKGRPCEATHRKVRAHQHVLHQLERTVNQLQLLLLAQVHLVVGREESPAALGVVQSRLLVMLELELLVLVLVPLLLQATVRQLNRHHKIPQAIPTHAVIVRDLLLCDAVDVTLCTIARHPMGATANGWIGRNTRRSVSS